MAAHAVVTDIPLDLIDPGQNDRTLFDAEKLQELADSIRENGLAQPITVRPMPGGRFQIVAGERRFRAMRLTGAVTIPALVRELSDERAAAIMLAENTSRDDLDPVDEARAYQTRMDRFKWTMQQVADHAGVSMARVRDRLNLLGVRDDILHLVRSGNFPVGHAQRLHVLDTNRQMLAARALSSGQTVTLADFQRLVDHLFAEQQQSAFFDLSAFDLAAPVAVEGQVLARYIPPFAPHLPPFQPTRNDSIAKAMLHYIAALVEAGHEYEALVIGTALKGLLEHNKVRLPMVWRDEDKAAG